MNAGRILRVILMILFLVPGFLTFLDTNFFAIFIVLFLVSLIFWTLVSWLAAGPMAHWLVNVSLGAEGSSRKVITSSRAMLIALLEEEGPRETSKDKNPCLLLPSEYTAKAHGVVDWLDRTFLPTSLVIGVVAVYLMIFDFLGIPFLLHPLNPLLFLIYVFSPGLVSFIIIPIWLVNDTRARIHHLETGEIRRIGEALKTVIFAIAGFGALWRLATSLFIDYVILAVWVWVIVFFVIPLPIFLTTIIYLESIHPRKVAKIEVELEKTLS